MVAWAFLSTHVDPAHKTPTQTHPCPHGDSCCPAVISGPPAALCEGRFYLPILCNTSSRLRRTSRRSAAACGTQQHLRLDSNTNCSFCTGSSPVIPEVLLLVPESTNTLDYKEMHTTTIAPEWLHHSVSSLWTSSGPLFSSGCFTSSMFAAFIHAQLSELCGSSLVFMVHSAPPPSTTAPNRLLQRTLNRLSSRFTTTVFRVRTVAPVRLNIFH